MSISGKRKEEESSTIDTKFSSIIGQYGRQEIYGRIFYDAILWQSADICYPTWDKEEEEEKEVNRTGEGSFGCRPIRRLQRK